MESLPQVSVAMEQVLTQVADEAAAAVGFIRRRRVLTGAPFVQALVLGWPIAASGAWSGGAPSTKEAPFG